MPWLPELFSAPELSRLEDKRRARELIAVSYFAGVMAGELDALIGSFVGEPEVHHPVRGRVKGPRAFAAFVTETNGWLEERDVSIEDVDVLSPGIAALRRWCCISAARPGRWISPGDRCRPTAGRDQRAAHLFQHVAADRRARKPSAPAAARPAAGPARLVGEYQRALAAGDLDAIVATFERHAYAREPAGGRHVHNGPEGLREFYEFLFSNNGGLSLEYCALTDDGRACAVEYNVVRWGHTELPPEAGIAVYVRGERGKLAAARIYDDADPPT